MVLWKGRPRRKPSILGRVLNPCGGETHCLREEAAPTCSHSAVVASAAKGQLSLGSLNPKSQTGKEAGRPFRPPLL